MAIGGGLDRTLSRRSLLQTTLGAGAAAFTLSGCVAVDQPVPEGPLAYTPGYFIVYVSTPGTDPSKAGSFGFPDTPGSAGYNDKDYTGRNQCVTAIFDTRNVIREADGDGLRTELKFTQPGALVGRPKPYELLHRGNGRYTAVTPIEFEPPRLPGDLLWSFLNEEDRWRAVVGDYIALDGPGGEFDWAVTRADFYRLTEERPIFDRSMQYLFWADDPTRGNDFGTNPSFCTPYEDIPSIVATAAANQISAGRLSTEAPLAVNRIVPTPEPTQTSTDEPAGPERPEQEEPPAPDSAEEAAESEPAEDSGRSDEAEDKGRSDEAEDKGRSDEAEDTGGSDKSDDKGGSDKSDDKGGSGDSGGSTPTETPTKGSGQGGKGKGNNGN